MNQNDYIKNIIEQITQRKKGKQPKVMFDDPEDPFNAYQKMQREEWEQYFGLDPAQAPCARHGYHAYNRGVCKYCGKRYDDSS